MILELKRFKKVAEVGSITKTCDSLFITQPALTQSIHRLEEELGIKLFKQSGKRISITEKGKIIYDISDRILQLWEKAKALKRSKNYTIYAIGLFDNAALQLSSYLQNKLKDTKLEIIIDRSTNLLKKVQLGIIEVCICVKPKDLSPYPNVILVKAYEEKLILVSSVKWGKPLKEVPFILYDKNSVTQQYIEETFIKAGVQPNVIAESVNPLFLKELALKGYGVAILPENMVKQDIKEKRLFVQKIPISFERTCGIFQNKDFVSPGTEHILGEIISKLE